MYTDILRHGRPEAGPARHLSAPVVDELTEPCDEGLTVKFVQRLDGPNDRRFADQGLAHLDIESVLIPMIGRTGRKTYTLCVSSQVGCAMGCRFCETAQMGLVRSLTPTEITGQWWTAEHVVMDRHGLRDHKPGDPPTREPHRGRPPGVANIVFMGMGEPLDNLDSVLDAIAALTDHRGAAMPMSAITISTVGRVDGLRRLVDVVQQPGWKRLGLALSLNAPNDTVRDDIMPLNRKWGMDELREVMQDLVRVRGTRKILFEYVLIPGVNDGPEHARQVAHWLAPFMRTAERGHIGLLNVIPYNPRRDSPWPAPDEADVKRFVDELAALDVYVKRRRTKGRSRMAACGQLGAAHIRRRQYVPLTGTGADGA